MEDKDVTKRLKDMSGAIKKIEKQGTEDEVTIILGKFIYKTTKLFVKLDKRITKLERKLA